MTIASIFGTLGLVGILLVIGIPVILLLWAVGGYNGLVRLRNLYRNAFSQIDVQLKRRYDLIPNLVEVVKGYMKHERETLDAVIRARAQASEARERAAANPASGEAMQSLAAAESGLSGVLGRLFALSEAYPELRSNENMKQLQEELASTENKIAFARQAYNDAVTRYNTKRESFPTSFLADVFKFGPATLFEISDEAARGPVKVDFGG